jgi:stage IV sporulation protein FB
MPRFGLKTGVFSTVLFFILLSFSLHHGRFSYTLLALAALAIHEFTHLLSCELLDYPVQEFCLNILGGCLKVDPSFAINPAAESLIAAAGPFANLLMVGGVLYLRLLGINNVFLEYWLQINLLIGSVNLIPATPLDGGRILHAWLNKNLGLKNSSKIAKKLTAIIGTLFLILGIVHLYNQQSGLIYLLIGSFIVYQLFTFKNPELNLVLKTLQHKKKQLAVKGFLPIKPVFVEPTALLRIPLQYYGSSDYLLFFMQDKEQKMCIISEDSAWNSLINQDFDATFSMIKNVSANILEKK